MKNKESPYTLVRLEKKTVKKLKRLKLDMDLMTYDEVIQELLYVNRQK